MDTSAHAVPSDRGVLRSTLTLALIALWSLALGCTRSVATDSGLETENTSNTELIWQDYLRAPDTQPNIPNVSWAGYHYGEKALPHIEGPVYDVKQYGAVGDGVVDDTAAIRAALDAAAKNESGSTPGGVVFFPRGRYSVSEVLFVHSDHTVLRGEDREGTEIIFTRPLSSAYGPSHLDNATHSSRWSWQGGLIWFTPRSANTWRADNSPLEKGSTEQWTTQSDLGRVVVSARRGDRTVTLDRAPDKGALQPGDFVLLTIEQPADLSLLKYLCGDGPWAEAYDWRQNNSSGFGSKLPQPLRWPVEVTGIEGPTLTLRQPLRVDIRPEWDASIARLGDTIRESGIENLTVRCLRDYSWSWDVHNREEGWNGPWFNQAINCWLRDVTVIDSDNGLGVAAGKCVTFTNFTLAASDPKLERHHHGTTCRSASADCLFENFQIISHPIHGLNVEQFSCGNVWSRGFMAHGTFDTHRNMPYDNVRTEITVNNDGRHGGSGGPVMGARFVNWNVEVTNHESYAIAWANLMPMGALVGLRGVEPQWDARAKLSPTGPISGVRVEAAGGIPEPANLYESQRRLRLGAQAPTPLQ